MGYYLERERLWWPKLLKIRFLIKSIICHKRILRWLIIWTRQHKLVILSLHHFKLHLLLHHHFHVLLELNHHRIFWHLVDPSFHLLHVWHHLLSMHTISGKIRIYSHHVWIIKGRPSRCTHNLFHITMSSVTNISKLTSSHWARLIPTTGITESSLSWHSF